MIFEDGDEENPFVLKNKDFYGEFNTSEFYMETCKNKDINQEKTC